MSRIQLVLLKATTLLVGAVILGASNCSLAATQNEQDLAARISGVPVMYQSLMWVGSIPPSNEENEILWGIIQRTKGGGLAGNMPAFEQFLTTHTNSPWASSLHANLARGYEQRGRYSKALEHWEAAWAITRNETEGAGKSVGDFALAYWVKTLVGLGRVATLKTLFEETQGRPLDGGPLQQTVNTAHEGYIGMCQQPGISFKCGTFALEHVARAIKGSFFDAREIRSVPSPSTGFSMSKLIDLAHGSGVDLVAVEWEKDGIPVVPSIVHWKQNHYGAILAMQGGRYEVVDAPLGKPRWMSEGDLREEASGQFLVPKDQVPSDWRLLPAAETDLIYGKGWTVTIDDPCDSCSNGSGGSDPPGAGGGGSGSDGDYRAGYVASGTGGGSAAGSTSLCPGCGGGGANGADGAGETCDDCNSDIGTMGPFGGNPGGRGGSGGLGGGHHQINYSTSGGMPRWKVSEPYINVWLYDEPLGYQAGLGQRISFRAQYKQREASNVATNFFSLGNMWECSWESFILDNTNDLAMLAPGGGMRHSRTNAEYLGHVDLTRSTNSSGDWTGAVVSYKNGAKDYYGFVPQYSPDPLHPAAYLTAKVDPSGHTNRFIYQEVSSPAYFLRLVYVIDADGRTNTLTYTNTSYPAQITGVTDPFGRSTVLRYDSAGRLTNIVDVAQLSSSFTYDNQGWVTKLLTPYGTNTFTYWTNNTGSFGETGGAYPGGAGYNPNLPIRAVTIVNPELGTNIYALMQDAMPFVPPAYTNYVSYEDPAVVPNRYEMGDMVPYFDTQYLWYRDSFHWGPKQAAGRPLNITNFTQGDFVKARMRHWLHVDSAWAISQTLSIQQDPSPDGINPGQTTWFNYYGKEGIPAEVMEGTNSRPALIARVLPDGTTAYTWLRRDAFGNVTNRVETYSAEFGDTPLTRTNVYIYDANGIDLLRMIGPKGEMIAGYGYDTNHHVVSATNAVGDVTSYSYDGAGRLISTKSPAGLTTINTYFSSGEYTNWVQMRVDLEIGRTNYFTYTNNLILTHTDERGLTSTNTWDNLQRLTSVSDPRGIISYVYTNLDLIRVVDRLGYSNSYAYDRVGRRTAETNALGYFTLFNYCTCGALDSIRDAGGNYTYFYYDNAGRKTQSVFPDNSYTVNYNYNLIGQVTNVTDNGGYSVTNWFNNQGLQYAVSNAFGQVSFTMYDIEDRATNNMDGNGVIVTNSYDNLGRVLARGYPDGGVERFLYTTNGLVAYTNQLGRDTHYVYDAAMRKIAETNANHEVTQFGYDAAGDLLTRADGKNQTTSWGYDQFGRVTNKLDALNNWMFKYTYDADNRLSTRQTPEKGTTAYYYDKEGNLTNVVYAVSPAITLKYDAMNRLTNMVDGIGTTAYGYDAAGQLLSEDGPWADDTVSYTYSRRLRTSLSLLAPDASPWAQNYGYDLARRLTNVTSSAGSFRYVYDSLRHQMVGQILLPNGASITNAYDTVARMTFTAFKNSTNAVFDSWTYYYNQGNQRFEVSRPDGGFIDYTYDHIGQLTEAGAWEEDGTTPRLQEQFGYTYDAAGNLNQRTANALVQTFNVNSLNELTNATRSGTLTVAGTTTSQATNVTVNSVSADLYADYTFAKDGFTLSDGNNTFTAIAHDSYGRASTNTITCYLPATNIFLYDSNGNLTNDGHRNFAYDDENQLISVWVSNVWRSDFAYDGKMRRRVRFESAWGGTSWITNTIVRYVYDGNLVLQERDTNNLPLVTYTRGRDLSGSFEGAGGIGGLLARTDNPSTLNPQLSNIAHSYYHGDGNGNITCLINSSQAIVAKYLYDPFGRILSQSGPLADANLYRFSSKEFHAVSGLVYYLYRIYDPNLQRWLNRDPLVDESALMERPKAGTGLPKWYLRHEALQNPYDFIRNSPIIYVDSDGRTLIVIGLGTGVLITIGQGATIGLIACYAIPSCRAALTRALERAAEKVKEFCEPRPPRNTSCSWTGNVVEHMPGIKECEYRCADGSTIYRSPTVGGACADVVTKYEPMRPW